MATAPIYDAAAVAALYCARAGVASGIYSVLPAIGVRRQFAESIPVVPVTRSTTSALNSWLMIPDNTSGFVVPFLTDSGPGRNMSRASLRPQCAQRQDRVDRGAPAPARAGSFHQSACLC
jgi:hypothetical protein